MVVFTCSACGESLKKNKVDQHYAFKCAHRPLLTCVDCLKDFSSVEYGSHTKCVTEEERYGAKGASSKVAPKKGERKQAERMRLLREYVQEQNIVDPGVKSVLSFLIEVDNVPSKKKPLFNMLRNHGSFRSLSDSVLEGVWAVLEDLNKTVSSSLQNTGGEKVKENGENCQNGEKELEEEEQIKKKKKKPKSDPSLEAESIDQGEGESLARPEDSTVVNEKEQIASAGSKKEKKKIRKKEKYERELMDLELEGSKKTEIDETCELDDKTSCEKSSRKRKRLANEESNKENGVIPLRKEGDESKSKQKKKKRKRNDVTETSVDKQDCEEKQEIVAGSTVKEDEKILDVSQEMKKTKFNWEEIVLCVLKKKSELSVKRLQKKVVNEYLSSGSGEKSLEKAIAKFNKKIMKIPGVKIKKGVAKLVM